MVSTLAKDLNVNEYTHRNSSVLWLEQRGGGSEHQIKNTSKKPQGNNCQARVCFSLKQACKSSVVFKSQHLGILWSVTRDTQSSWQRSSLPKANLLFRTAALFLYQALNFLWKQLCRNTFLEGLLKCSHLLFFKLVSPVNKTHKQLPYFMHPIWKDTMELL